MSAINPPPLRVPRSLSRDRETFNYFLQLHRFLLQMWTQIGGASGGGEVVSGDALFDLPQSVDTDPLERLVQAMDTVGRIDVTAEAIEARSDPVRIPVSEPIDAFLFDPRSFVDESGSNANGRYVKFSDGTMICTREVDRDMTTLTSLQAYDFPASFIDKPSASWSVSGTIDGSDGPALADMWVEARDETQWVLRGNTNLGADTTTMFALNAIGRWK